METEKRNQSEAPTISFGFKATSDSKKLQTKSIIDESKSEVLETDFVKGFDGEGIQSVIEKPKPSGPLVIPLIRANNWRRKETQSVATGSTSNDEPEKEDLSKAAAKELIDEAKKFDDDQDSDQITHNSTKAIPLLLQNQVPAGFETDDKIDTELRPEESSLEDYEQVPIEQFGLALLRGMGWKEGEGVGKNKQYVKPIEANLRPKGMGLGADKSKLLQQNGNKRKHKLKPGEKREEEESLEIKKGALCVILKGAHTDLYGTIEGVDDDNARCVVKLAISQASVDLSQFSLRVISKQEFDKYARYLNKGKSDRYKEKEVNGTHSPAEKKWKKDYDNDSKNKDGSKHSKTKSKHYDQPKLNKNWVYPLLKVKIIDRKYKDGRYYANKVIVYEILPGSIVCQTESGRLLEDLQENQLESVIPREDKSHVMIVAGEYKKEIAELIQKNKEREKVTVQLLSDRSVLMTLPYDDVCEYTGNVDQLMEY